MIEFIRQGFGDELVIDNFAGGGGASTGIVEALGRPVDFAVNHSAAAIAMHAANHPLTHHLCESIWEVDPKVVCGSRRVRLAWFSPDCFPAGTLVLTREGYRPIEQIAVGDEVLTHNLRWRRVTATMSTVRTLLRLRGHGHPGLAVSIEHPFYARHRVNRWNNERHAYDRVLEPSAWVPADLLGAGWYWATPYGFPAADVPEVPVYRGRSMTVAPELLWLAGRYIADGWTRLTETRAELVITCGRHEVEALRERLNAWERKGPRAGADEMAWYERETGTAYQFSASHRGLVEWLRTHFGHGAAEKLIPGWALGMDPMHRKALLEGYLSGDGWRGTNTGAPVTECSTVSKALAFGIKALASSLGKTVTVSLRKQNGNGTIQGRAINTLPSWQLRWRDEVDISHRQTSRENGLEWAPIREQTCSDESAEVFNLSVEDDESYVAEGIVVHNCTHFSKAKGAQPRSKDVRGLADVVIRWARAVRPRVIVVENVEEFLTWGPLDEGKPIKERAGEDFRRWFGELVACGYTVDHRMLVAADYGTPTTRKRLVVVARCDGQPIVWPAPTHGKGRAQPWRTAAEIIDWSLPCPSIFGRKRALAPATMRRIAAGLQRYVIDNPRPFIVKYHGGHGRGPWRGQDVTEPLRTVDTENRFGLVTPYLMTNTTGHSGRAIEKPVPTITTGDHHYLVTPFIKSDYSASVGRDMRDPLPTVTAGGGGHHSLVVPTLIQTGYGEREGQAPRVLDLHKPLGTVVAGGRKHALVAAFLAKHYSQPSGKPHPGIGCDVPLSTVTTADHHSLVTAELAENEGHTDEVRAFLVKYYGSSGRVETQKQALVEPLDTATTKARFGLVTVHGCEYVITDIGMRMLSPRELFNAQGFPEDYIIDLVHGGKPLTKTTQIELAGNSVCCQKAEAVVGANLFERWGMVG